ncbi:MAG: citramalate synthase [Lentisphaerae bacterium]|nr:MAG: citramalate synthase [Lentisphaerota bacterium]
MNERNDRKDVLIYDTTLRDGSQGERVKFSKVDKLRITEFLDDFGVDYVEGGWPGANPTDEAFFEEAKQLQLKQAKLVAFGSTCRVRYIDSEDPLITALLKAETPAVTIFGKSWLLHVTDVLRISPEENLKLIARTCEILRNHGREVIYDAEHFFDGYTHDPEYALKTLKTAAENGAQTIVLCDTNGGKLPHEIAQITEVVRASLPEMVNLGIHAHNDSDVAVANSFAAILAGANHVQGTINGLGERCGNANLCSVMAGLELKLNKRCLPEGSLERLTELSRFVDELANLDPHERQPYVGRSAFAHKAGVHVDAIQKNEISYEHIPAQAVGNQRRILLSDYSGGSNIVIKAAEHNITLSNSKAPEVRAILGKIKELEHQGYEFEAANASFELLIRKELGQYSPAFTLEGFRVIVEKRGHDEEPISEATIKLTVDGKTELTVAEGDGPVHALDRALRKALEKFYPEVSSVTLRDYKVRIIDAEQGTAAKTRVIIESSDGSKRWGTVGVHENIIEASWEALLDSVEYKICMSHSNSNPKEV